MVGEEFDGRWAVTGAFEVGDRVMASGSPDASGLGTIEYIRSAEEQRPRPIKRPYLVRLDKFVHGQTHIFVSGDELERIEDDGQMGRQGTTDNPVPASVARSEVINMRSAGTTDQSPYSRPKIAIQEVAAEDELAALIAEQIDLGMSVTFTPTMGWIEVSIDPYDDDDGEADGRSGTGLTALDAMYIALDVERET